MNLISKVRRDQGFNEQLNTCAESQRNCTKFESRHH